MNKYNIEGYNDPTAYEALSRIESEEKKSKRKFRPLVYICSPYAGDVKGNTQNARIYSRFAVNEGYVPLAPHLLFPQFMNDTDQDDRETAMNMNRILLGKCHELWVFGNLISAGMGDEIWWAQITNKKIRYFDKNLKEVYR